MVRYGDLFWKALVLTVIVFLLGVFLGFSLERNRVRGVEYEYRVIELESADAKLQSIYYQNLDPKFCDSAIEENLNFADRVYQEGLKIEDFDKASFLTDDLELEKKKYALLKVEFWLNSIVLKERCDADYMNLVYFFDNDPDFDTKAEQNAQSGILKDLKEKYGRDLMLIPLPLDMDISIVNVMKGTYDITTTPTILINEEMKLEGLQSLEKLDKLVA
jgi:hypothetical protein